MGMTKDEFGKLLKKASETAISFGKHYITDTLHQEVRYTIYLNSSFDDLISPSFTYYPDDDNKIIEDLTEEKAIDILCRDNKVPVWIDISLSKIKKNCTVLKLICAGRYSDKFKDYHYPHTGLGPFGIKSPDLPFTWKDGDRFSIKAS